MIFQKIQLSLQYPSRFVVQGVCHFITPLEVILVVQWLINKSHGQFTPSVGPVWTLRAQAYYHQQKNPFKWDLEILSCSSTMVSKNWDDSITWCLVRCLLTLHGCKYTLTPIYITKYMSILEILWLSVFLSIK